MFDEFLVLVNLDTAKFQRQMQDLEDQFIAESAKFENILKTSNPFSGMNAGILSTSSHLKDIAIKFIEMGSAARQLEEGLISRVSLHDDELKIYREIEDLTKKLRSEYWKLNDVELKQLENMEKWIKTVDNKNIKTERMILLSKNFHSGLKEINVSLYKNKIGILESGNALEILKAAIGDVVEMQEKFNKLNFRAISSVNGVDNNIASLTSHVNSMSIAVGDSNEELLKVVSAMSEAGFNMATFNNMASNSQGTFKDGIAVFQEYTKTIYGFEKSTGISSSATSKFMLSSNRLGMSFVDQKRHLLSVQESMRAYGLTTSEAEQNLNNLNKQLVLLSVRYGQNSKESKEFAQMQTVYSKYAKDMGLDIGVVNSIQEKFLQDPFGFDQFTTRGQQFVGSLTDVNNAAMAKLLGIYEVQKELDELNKSGQDATGQSRLLAGIDTDMLQMAKRFGEDFEKSGNKIEAVIDSVSRDIAKMESEDVMASFAKNTADARQSIGESLKILSAPFIGIVLKIGESFIKGFAYVLDGIKLLYQEISKLYNDQDSNLGAILRFIVDVSSGITSWAAPIVGFTATCLGLAVAVKGMLLPFSFIFTGIKALVSSLGFASIATESMAAGFAASAISSGTVATNTALAGAGAVKNLGFFATYFPTFTKAFLAVKTFLMGLTLWPVLIGAAIIAAVAGIVYLIYTYRDEIWAVLKSVGSAIYEIGKILAMAIVAPFVLIGDLAKKIGGWIGGWFGYKTDEDISKIERPGKAGSFGKNKMADGGIITRETNVIAGEAGPEAIIPLSELYGNMTPAFSNSLKPVVNLLQQINDNMIHSVNIMDESKAIESNIQDFSLKDFLIRSTMIGSLSSAIFGIEKHNNKASVISKDYMNNMINTNKTKSNELNANVNKLISLNSKLLEKFESYADKDNSLSKESVELLGKISENNPDKMGGWSIGNKSINWTT